MTRLSAISVDLDSLKHYCRIFGVPEKVLDDRARGLVAEVAIPRFLELLADGSTPATFFVIGEELADPRLVANLQRARSAGVELASHSHRHDYRLSQLPVPRLEEDVAAAHQAMRAAFGVAPVGFRAPGYTLSAPLLKALSALGYRYDSSTFPAVPYWLAKAAVMGALAIVGRPSRALLDSPRVLLAPRSPYHPDPSAPYSRGASELLELPITVTPWLRVPFYGTFATLAPGPLLKQSFARLEHDLLINFELHAIDVLDASDGVPVELLARQRDLRVPASQKVARLRSLFGWLGQSRERVTLAQAALRLRGSQ